MGPPVKPTLLSLVLFELLTAAPAHALPPAIGPLLPAHYHVLSSADLRPTPRLRFHIVALARDDEPKRGEAASAPSRPLLILEDLGGRARLVGRNVRVVMRADEGGQCDPFTDADQPIAAKGRYFTVENGVACGAHWTDYITFRFDNAAGGFVFDNERSENWVFNPSQDPNAEALVRDGPQKVRRSPPGRTVTFSTWRPSR